MWGVQPQAGAAAQADAAAPATRPAWVLHLQAVAAAHLRDDVENLQGTAHNLCPSRRLHCQEDGAPPNARLYGWTRCAQVNGLALASNMTYW